MKRVLISGSSGLLGSNLARYLKKKNFEVYEILRKRNKYKLNNKIKTIDFNSNWNTNILPKNIDIIIHLSQSNHFRNFPKFAIDIFKVNLESTAKLLDYATKTGVKKFIYTSSGAVYGNSKLPMREEYLNFPGHSENSYYATTKYCAETLVKSYSSLITGIILRPFFIYGAGQNRNMLMPRLFDKILNNKEIFLNGKNGIKINPIHVEDATKALFFAMKINTSSTYNLAGPQILSIREICNIIGKKIKKKPRFKILQKQKTFNLVADITKMKLKIYNPKKKLSENLVDLEK